MSNEIEGRELDWNDHIEHDGNEFVLLPEGDYDFTITAFERARHGGSAKLPPCNKAIVHAEIKAPQGTTTIKHNLFLHTKTEGLLCDFFKGIGQRQKGQKITMDWDKVVGSTGKCKVGIRSFTGNKGETIQINEIKKFYEPEAQSFQAGRF